MLHRFASVLLGLLLGAPAMADVMPPLNSIDAFKVITVEGEDLPMALGLPLEDLSLAAVVDNVLEPIPFQFDQYNIGGAVWFDGWDVPMAGDPERLDPTDKLLFLYKDAGARRNPNDIYDGTILGEIRLDGADGTERYVYLVRGSRLRSDEQYVRYSAEMGLVDTDFYTLRYNRDNHLKWDDFQAINYVGERPLDSLKLRLNAGLVAPILPAELNNDNLVALPKGERIGPIRTTTQLETTLYLMKVPVLKMSLQIHHYPKSVLYDVRVIMPEVRRHLLYDPSITMSLDANRLLGASIRFANTPTKEPGIVDGKINEVEQAMRNAAFTPEMNWIWVSTKRNLDVVSFIDYLGEFNEPLAPFLEDDFEKADPPEVFPGQLPNVGYTIKSFPLTGFVGFVVSIHMDTGFQGEPEDFTVEMRTLPHIQVRTL